MGRKPSRPDYERPYVPTNQELVEALKIEHPEIKTTGLMRELAIAFPNDASLDLPEFTKVPDAYILRPAERTLDVFEVEVSHPLSKDTMAALCNLWSALDAWDVEMRLYTVTRYGHINEIDLSKYYFQLCHPSSPPPTLSA